MTRGYVRAAVVLLLALAVLAPQVRAQPPAARPPVPGAPAGVTAFVNVNVIPMDTERVLASQTVLVEGGWVTALGPTNQFKVPAGATRIDGRGHYLIPGLADMHAHLTHSYAAGFRDSVNAEQRLFLWLAHGLTTIRNMTHFLPEDALLNGNAVSPEEVLRLRARAATGALLSPRIYAAGVLRGAEREGTGRRVPIGTRPSAIAHALQLADVVPALTAYKAAGYDFVKPHWLYQHRAVFDSLAATARQLGLPLDGHVDGVTTTARALETYRSIEHMEKWAYQDVLHPDSAGFGDTARIQAWAVATQRAGVWNCPTLYNGLAFGPSPKQRAVIGQLVTALQAAGAGLLLGSDRLEYPKYKNYALLHENTSSPPDVPRDLDHFFDEVYGDPGAPHRELETLVQAGLTPYQALATGTRNVAAFFQALAERGMVAVGQQADLVLLGANPLVDIRHTQQIAGVMRGGHWLGRAELDRRIEALKAALRPQCTAWAAAKGQPPC